MSYNSILEKIKGQKYPKEVVVDDNDKLLFYYVNKAKEQGGGVFVYRVPKYMPRPELKIDVYNALSEGRTSAFAGEPNYTIELHRALFDTKNRLF